MNIVFFSENGFNGGVPRSHSNMRTEFAFMAALNAIHYNFDYINNTTNFVPNYDLGIVILPKNKNPSLDKIYKLCNKVAIFQEGPNNYYHNYNTDEQKKYLSYLTKADFLLVHNDYDLPYFSALTGKNCYVLNTLMITDEIQKLERPEKRQYCMIGGGFTEWYGGTDSTIAAMEFDTMIGCPQMGKNNGGENKYITVYPYMDWLSFQCLLNQFKYAVHLMRTIAAGSFMLNAAYLGIPCICYDKYNTSDCHPFTRVEIADLKGACNIAKRLRDNEGFYKECSITARKIFDDKFSEPVWLERWNTICKKEGLMP